MEDHEPKPYIRTTESNVEPCPAEIDRLSPTARVHNATLYHAEAFDFLRAYDGEPFDAVVTDPPYSSGGQFRSDRTAKTSAKYQNSEQARKHLYAEFTGDNRDQRGYLAWCALWMDAARRVTKPGGLFYCFCDWRQLPITTDAVQAAGWIWRGIVPWNKTQSVRPQLGRPRAQCEYVVWCTNGPRPNEGPTAPGYHEALEDAGPPAAVTARVNHREKVHIAGKPVALMRELLALVPAGGLVLDPFAGSASTLIAANQLGLRSVGVELDPTWHALAAKRLATCHDAASPATAASIG